MLLAFNIIGYAWLGLVVVGLVAIARMK